MVSGDGRERRGEAQPDYDAVVSLPAQACDVLVLGGGPAGATAAAVAASAGATVVLAEQAHFPRAHVGESLRPATFALLDQHLGLGERIAAQGFARRYGAAYVWGDSRTPWTVLCDARLDEALRSGRLPDADAVEQGGFAHAWQVDRARFDSLLLDAAVEAGAEVHQGTTASEVLCGPREDGMIQVDGAVLSGPAGVREVRAATTIDATGHRSLLARTLGLHLPLTDLQATATYTYVRGAGGARALDPALAPLDRNLQLVVSLPEGWAWFIPVGPERTSIGIVHKVRKQLDAESFWAAVAAAGLPTDPGQRDTAGLPADAEGMLFARAWSYRTTAVAGPGWLLAGDAAGFVDPILSGGVDLAVRSGVDAAKTALLAAERADAARPGLLAAYDARLRGDLAAYLRLARYWYGNNRSVAGQFWAAQREVPADAIDTPARAFVYLTSGRYAADRDLAVFQDWQEQRIFEALGVDKAALRRGRRKR